MRKLLLVGTSCLTTIVLVLALGCATGKAKAASISLLPAADGAFVDTNLDGTFDSPFSANFLVYQLSSPATSFTPMEHRSALEFGISEIPRGSTVVSAVLHLFLFGFGINPDAPIPHSLEINGYAGDGAITFDDMTRLNRVAGPIVSTEFFELQGALAHVDVSSFVQSLVSDADAFAGFMIRTTTDAVGSIDSLESAAGQLPLAFPTLTVVFESGAPIVEPPTLALLGLGLAGLGFGRRKQ
jgi:hypothetical protein